jgi:hypothetical protein
MSTILSMCGPGWFAANAYNEDSGIKELYRTCLLMDMREMDDRVRSPRKPVFSLGYYCLFNMIRVQVWTSSAEWTYSCIRRVVRSISGISPSISVSEHAAS